MSAASLKQYSIRLGLCLLATLIVTAILLYLARQHKRLLNYPYYDDVSYLDDGWEKLTALRTGGIPALVRQCSRPPPHSPFSTALAMGSFALFGRHEWPPYNGNGSVIPEWGPYLGNGIIVLFLFLCVDRLLGPDRPWWQRLLMLLLISVIRLPSVIIWNFKPDAFWGIVTAAAVISALHRPLKTWTQPFLTGLLFGIALLAKPSISPLTLILFFVTLVFWAVALWRENPNSGPWPVAGPLLLCLNISLLICIPFIAVGGLTATYDYIFNQVLGESRDVWVLPLTPLGHATYFLYGPGGIQIIGPAFAIFFALLIIGAFRLFKNRRNLPIGRGVRILGLMAATLTAYAIPTLETVKNQNFGSAFQCLVIFSAILILADILRSNPKFGSYLLIVSTLAAIILAVIPFTENRRREYWLNKNDPEVIGLNQLAERIYNDLRGVKVTAGNPTQVLLGVEDKAINPATMQWLAYGDRPFNMLTDPNWGNPQSEAATIAITHVFVTADPQNAPTDRSDLIGPANEHRLSNEFLHRTDFRLIDSYRAFNGKTYYVFQRIGI